MTGAMRGRTSAAAELTGYLLQSKNDPPRIGTALVSRYSHCPAFARERQFLLGPLALQKQALAAASEEGLGQTEQTVERRTSARSHNINRMLQHCFNTARADEHVSLGNAHSLAQKRAFSRIGLDQLDAGDTENRQNETGQSGAASEIDKGARRRRQ